jgi:hypothetical protein
VGRENRVEELGDLTYLKKINNDASIGNIDGDE